MKAKGQGTEKLVGTEEGKTVYNPYSRLLRLLRTENSEASRSLCAV